MPPKPAPMTATETWLLRDSFMDGIVSGTIVAPGLWKHCTLHRLPIVWRCPTLFADGCAESGIALGPAPSRRRSRSDLPGPLPVPGDGMAVPRRKRWRMRKVKIGLTREPSAGYE